jgi:ribosomal protein S18 acetylase RimI-like enzyme
MVLEKRNLHPGDLDELAAVHKSIIGALKDKQQYANTTRSEFEEILCGQGMAMGTFDKGKLVGFCIFLFPGDSGENLGIDIGLAEDELDSVVHMEAGAVLSEYRGMALVADMANELLERIKAGARYRYVLSTVHPLNIPSLRIQFKFGLKIVALKEKYGGLMRYILMHDLHEKVQTVYCRQRSIECRDFETQISLLSQGFKGIGFALEQGKEHIIFAK